MMYVVKIIITCVMLDFFYFCSSNSGVKTYFPGLVFFAFYLFIYLFIYLLCRAIPVAYGSSQDRVKSELQLLAYTTAPGNTRSLTHRARPGIEPASS